MLRCNMKTSHFVDIKCRRRSPRVSFRKYAFQPQFTGLSFFDRGLRRSVGLLVGESADLRRALLRGRHRAGGFQRRSWRRAEMPSFISEIIRAG